MKDIETVANAVMLMDKQLREELFVKNGKVQAKKLWENTYIKRQIDRRNNGGVFTVSDHIRGMVYAMLTSGATWNRLEPYIDISTGQIVVVDEIFCQYSVDDLLNADSEILVNKIKKYHLGTPYIRNQIDAIIGKNIRTLLSLEMMYGSIDNFYRIFACKGDNLKTLVKELSAFGKHHKFAQLGEAMTAEYLKNVGYDIGKPDRHICRILGSEYFGYSIRKNASPDEVIDTIAAIAKNINKSAAETDYILWAYCAKGFGEVCTKKAPKCDICVANTSCINF